MLLLLLVTFFANALNGSTPEFVVLICSYNNEKYVERNLDSVLNQKTTAPYSIICVNDCSSDKTGTLMEQYKKEKKLSDSFLTIIHNTERMGATANIYNTIHQCCKDHQIVIILDGDDTFSHARVIERLVQEYASGDIWLTYGSFIFYPSGQKGTTYEITRSNLFNRELRSLVYVAQALRTFKVALFKKIKKEDLMDQGKFMSMNSDMAMMIPMLEMCAPVSETAAMHCSYIPDILYVYNYINPISDFRTNRQLQIDLEKVIRERPVYKPLTSLEN